MNHRKQYSANRLLQRSVLTALLFIVFREFLVQHFFDSLEHVSPIAIVAADLLLLALLVSLFIYRDAKGYLFAVEKYRDDEELFSTFIRYSPIFTYIKEVTSERSIVLRCSDNFSVMTGIVGEQMIGKRMEEIFPPDFAAKITADDWEVVSRGSILRMNEELNGRSYTTVKFPITIGSRSLLAGYTIDITDYTEAEERLKESEEKYRALVEWSPDAIAIHVNGRIAFVNNACLALMRAADKDALMGRSVIDFVHPDFRTLVVERMKQREHEGKDLPIVQERFIRSDGTMVDVEVKSIPIIFAKQPAVQLIVRDITDRKRAEEKLEEAEEKYRGLSDAAFESIFISEDGICLEQNAMAEQMFGFTSQETFGRLLTDMIIPADRSAVHERMQLQFEQPYESTALRKDGTTFPCTLRGKLMKYRGRTVRVISLRDNSERTMVLNSLRESERMLKVSQEASRIGSFVFTIHNNTWTGSEILAVLFGIQPKEKYLIEEWLSVIHPDDTEKVQRHFAEDVIGRKERFTLEYRIINQQTRLQRWVMGIGELECDDAGLPLRLIGTIQDISERKDAETALRESEGKYRSLIENVNTGIVAHAPDTHIIFCNETASVILGLTRDQMLGKTAMDPEWHFIRENGEQLPLAEYPVNRALSPEGFEGIQILGVVVPGREGPTWVQGSAHRSFDRSGAITQVVVSFFDITFRKNAEASLKESEMRFKKILQDVQSVAVQGYGPDGTVQYWNKAS
ncbi:MAG: PAS domain S-box protein, partial [Bacteroidetes bacterium]|nr:PAS domain S-box protein [Bacteroidota bacterium]